MFIVTINLSFPSSRATIVADIWERYKEGTCPNQHDLIRTLAVLTKRRLKASYNRMTAANSNRRYGASCLAPRNRRAVSMGGLDSEPQFGLESRRYGP